MREACIRAATTGAKACWQELKEGPAMFGKPEWFTQKKLGWGLHPTSWQGWAYTAAWGGVIAAPFVGMMAFGKWPEAAVWLVASAGALVWDVKSIIAAKHPQPKKDVLYIGDDEDSVQTSKLDLRLRR
jgi:hypothetical protein